MSDIGVIKGASLVDLPDGATQREIIEAIRSLGETSMSGMTKWGETAQTTSLDDGTTNWKTILGISVKVTPPVYSRIHVIAMIAVHVNDAAAGDEMQFGLYENGDQDQTVDIHPPIDSPFRPYDYMVCMQYLHDYGGLPQTQYEYTLKARWKVNAGAADFDVHPEGTTLSVRAEPHNQVLGY
jgi:hypothetical protein